LRHRRPRIGRERPERQPDPAAPALRIGLELHDLRLHPLADLQHLGRMRRPGMAELAHVDQRLDAAEIHEGPEVAQRRDGPLDDRADAEPGPHRRGLRPGLLLQELPARDDDVAAAGIELRDSEAETLADVLCALRPPAIDLRPRTEGPHPGDLHVVAALVLPRDHALDRDPVRVRLLELARDVAPAARDSLQHDRPRARPVVDDRRLDLVALPEMDLARRRIAKLAELDRRLGLAADGDEGRRGADRDHPSADDVADGDAALAGVLPPALREE